MNMKRMNMKRFLIAFAGVFLACSVTVVAADTEGPLGLDSNPATSSAFDRIFAQAKEEGGIPPFFFQERTDSAGLEPFFQQGFPAHTGWPHSSVQDLVDRFFSEEFDPTPYTDVAEDGASDTEGGANGDDFLPFFSENGADQDSEGLNPFTQQNWLWSPGASSGDAWFSPEGWGSTER
jgi:hypothetical protein